MNTPDRLGITPLSWAASWSERTHNYDIVRVLLQAGADLEEAARLAAKSNDPMLRQVLLPADPEVA